ncbi:hypothetical protein M3Y96_00852800 [Aphelenchoides besseyi]|nr:hypothetical protein M3Y96_00852800 [Aphelenchoides besseyi]
MSDVDAPVDNGVNATSEDEFVDAKEENEEEQSAQLIQKEVKVEITDEDGNINGVDTAADDNTEDQVPDIDITGTDNVDPMTTSMDGIEDIPAEETQEPKEDENEIPVERFEDATEGEQAQDEAPKEEDVQVEESNVDESPVEETHAEEETPAEESNEQTAEETAVEEEQAQEQPQEETGEENGTEEQTNEEAPAENEEQQFELQAPPTPKRPRTPNELDNTEREPTPALSGQGSAVASQKGSVPATPRTPKTPSAVGSVRGSQVGSQPGTPTPESNVGSVRGSQVGSQVGSQPGTPKPESNVGSVPPTPKSGRASTISEIPKVSTPQLANGSIVGSPKGSAVGSAAATPRTAGTGTPRSKKAFDFDNVETPASPRTPKRTTFQDDNLSVARSPRTPRTPKSPNQRPAAVNFLDTKKTDSVVEQEEAPVEEQKTDEPVTEEPEPTEVPEETPQTDEAAEEPKEETETPVVQDEAPSSPPAARATSPSPPPRHRAQSPSPPPRRGRDAAPSGDYTSYDQDSHRETIPARIPAATSFSSWNPPERSSYQPISPWVNTSQKYQSEYTSNSTYHPPNTYTSMFDDLVNTGPFSQSLYATNRLLERSRSRTRERRQAFRSQRSASQYLRYSSQLPAPLRTREYSTPRSSSVSRVPGRYGSFTSFLDYSGSKNYELSRFGSRGSLYDSTQALSRSNSRGNIDYFLGAGRMSRVDSFVNNLNSRYEWQVPANHEVYHAHSRGQISYAPLNEYASYSHSNNSYIDFGNEARFRRSVREGTPVQWKSLYETRIGELQRSLSRERFERDRLKNKYSKVSYQLEQASKQMDLLRTNSYSSLSHYTPATPPIFQRPTMLDWQISTVVSPKSGQDDYKETTRRLRRQRSPAIMASCEYLPQSYQRWTSIDSFAEFRPSVISRRKK